jgi:cell division control protein 45
VPHCPATAATHPSRHLAWPRRARSSLLTPSRAPGRSSPRACRASQSLLQLDYITYTIKPVGSFADIFARFEQVRESMSETVRTLVLINCGGMIDLTQPELQIRVPSGPAGALEDLELYVLDAHRPLHLENVREDTFNVRVLVDSLSEAVVKDLVDLGTVLADSDAEHGDDSDSDSGHDDQDDELEREEQRRRLNDGRYATLSPNSKRGFRREISGHVTAYYRGSWSAHARSARGRLACAARVQGGARACERASAAAATTAPLRHSPPRRQPSPSPPARATAPPDLRRQGLSVASLCLELAVAQNRFTNELLWLSAVGLTDQFVHERIARERYLENVHRHHQLVLAVNASNAADAPTAPHVDDESGETVEVPVTSGRGSVRLIFEEEYAFYLYRHWSLYDAMMHSPYVASRLGAWTEQAEKKLRGLFASMGVPLVEVQQKWAYMKEAAKKELKLKLEEYAPRIGLGEYTYGSFVRVTGYRSQLAAADVVYAVAALLESAPPESRDAKAGADGGAGPEGGDDQNDPTAANGAAADPAAEVADGAPAAKLSAPPTWERAFWRAYDALNSHCAEDPALAAGLELAMQLQRAVVETGKIVIESKQMTSVGGFVRVVLAESPALHLFLDSPMALSRLALFLSDVQRESGRKRKPVVIAAPDVLHKTHLLVAVTGSARFGAVGKNNFGTRFRTAARAMDAHVKHERFDTATIEVASADLQSFWTELVNTH